jgi:prepilin signal peptidase PulO-like enzyme (type II secretory pathway)
MHQYEFNSHLKSCLKKYNIILPIIFNAGIYNYLYWSKLYLNIYFNIPDWLTIYTLDLLPYVICDIAHITSDNIYLLFVVSVPDFNTLHNN